MPPDAHVILDPDHVIGPVDPRLFGSFVEHMGRCVYQGIYEPSHPEADDHGFRRDVGDLVRELDVPIVRYPGGNFVSGYRWEDGVGPVDQRPVRLDLAWESTEPNQVGLNEFLTWCRSVDTEPMLAVNLGTRGVDAARSLVEYTNHPGGTAWSDLRAAHGFAEPHGVRTWCLGNEMDGPWQIGHKQATEYGRLALEAAKTMKWVDRQVELVVCGSSGGRLPTFPDWDRIVLEHTYEHVDYIALHSYIGRREHTMERYLASGVQTDTHIDAVVATCDHVRTKKRSAASMSLAFDEWNVAPSAPRHDEAPPREPWAFAPPIAEGGYTAADAVAFGGMLLSLIRHADRVRIGCQAQLVNVLGAIKTRTDGAAWREAIFYPYLHGSRWGRGTALQPVVRAPEVPAGDLGEVPALDVAACRADDGDVTVFAINRSVTDELTLTVELRCFGGMTVETGLTIGGGDLDARNTPNHPDAVVPEPLPAVLDGSTLTARLAPASWNVLRCVPAAQD